MRPKSISYELLLNIISIKVIYTEYITDIYIRHNGFYKIRYTMYFLWGEEIWMIVIGRYLIILKKIIKLQQHRDYITGYI